jgi:DNA processing protein
VTGNSMEHYNPAGGGSSGVSTSHAVQTVREDGPSEDCPGEDGPSEDGTGEERPGNASGQGATDDAERRARAALVRIAEPGDPRLGRLLAAHGAQEALQRIRSGGQLPDWLRVRLSGIDAGAELQRGQATGARFLCPGEPDWPSQLDDLGPTAPIGLWVRGELDLRLALLRSVSIVGARAASPYGLDVTAELAAGVAERDVTVVSGGAFGIDAAAHRGALAVGGTTLGVLACGVDVPYPRAHEALLERIAAEGCLLSEVAPGAAPMRRWFLVRNRLIAALSRGTVVVEAALRSGSLTTARHAEELGRVVMGVPGPVTSFMSAGVHELIRNGGAVLVTRPAEILEAIGRIGEDLAPIQCGPQTILDALPVETLVVFEALPARRPVPLAELAQTTGRPLAAVHAALGDLSARGLVERVDGGWRLLRRKRPR